MMKNYISSMAAKNAVMNELGLDGQEIYGLSVVRADGLYELRFCTDFTAYDCYADAVSGEVLGIDTRPITPETAGDACRMGA